MLAHKKYALAIPLCKSTNACTVSYIFIIKYKFHTRNKCWLVNF